MKIIASGPNYVRLCLNNGVEVDLEENQLTEQTFSTVLRFQSENIEHDVPGINIRMLKQSGCNAALLLCEKLSFPSLPVE